MASPLSISRPSSDDSHSAKLLKEVLRSSERLLASSREFQQRQTGWKVVAGDKAGQLRGSSGRKGNGTQSAVNLRDLHHSCRQRGLPDDTSGHTDLQEQVGQLDKCGDHISDLCARLLAPGLQMPPKYPPSDNGPHPGIAIVARAQANMKETRAQAERITNTYIGENVLFSALEDLADRIERSPGHAELREHFPRRHTHHQNVSLLSDYALEAGAPFKEAVWATSVGGHHNARLSIAPERVVVAKATGGFAENRRRKGHMAVLASPSNSGSERGADR